MPIPKIAHRIWFGEPFPEKYRQNLIRLAELNPTYKVILWSSKKILSVESYAELQVFCDTHIPKIELRNIDIETDLRNDELILQELHASEVEPKYKRLHYVRASDIARIVILLKMGGIYTDTDLEMTAPFPEMDSEHNILFKVLQGFIEGTIANYFTLSSFQAHRFFFPRMLYDFIAASPGHVILETSAQTIQIDYKTYSVSKNRQWEASDNREALAYGTVGLTGRTLKFALNYLYQSKQMTISDPAKLFLNTQSFIKDCYDKSWLEGFTGECKTHSAESIELDRFLNEIDEARAVATKFKLINYGDHPDLREEPRTNRSLLPSYPYPKDEKELINAIYSLKTLPEQEVKYKPFLLPDIKISEFKIPEFKIPEIKLPTVLTTDKIKEIYKKHGGGKFSMYRLFSGPTNVDQVIKKLHEKAKKNKEGASQKTLRELGM